MELHQIKKLCDKICDNVSKVIVGKREVMELIFISMVCDGHVLLEDVPGMGKTLLANTLSKSIDASFKRIQFTPDLLPSDLTGINYFNQKEGIFKFREGPLFSHIILADEINRATPRTQSSLLESMEEKQISIDGKTYELNRPYLVIATQNPVETQGTFPLPEAQLDRFLIKIDMGYPTFDEAITILKRFKKEKPQDNIFSVANKEVIIEAQKAYSDVQVSEEIFSYIIHICEATRTHPDILLGVSPRASLALLKASMVKAILMGRDYVVPSDIKYMAKYVLSHRIVLKSISELKHENEMLIEKIVDLIDVPTEKRIDL